VLLRVYELPNFDRLHSQLSNVYVEVTSKNTPPKTAQDVAITSVIALPGQKINASPAIHIITTPITKDDAERHQ
jgi:hypothetical protein